MGAVLGLLTAVASASAGVPRVYTVGSGFFGYSGDGGPAVDARVEPDCIAALADGSFILGGGARVRRIGNDGRIRTVAGTGRKGSSGDGGKATRARISGCSEDEFDTAVPGALAGLPDGGFLLASWDRIRRVGPDGVIRPFAGRASPAPAGSDYVAASETLVFAAGDTSKTITVYVKGDPPLERDGVFGKASKFDGRFETFNVYLSSPTNSAIADGTGVGTIEDDDPR